MRNLFKPIGLALVLCACLAFEGCANRKLETGGRYAPGVAIHENGVTNIIATAAPDIGLFTVDSTFEILYSTIQTVFATERRNRDLLWSVSHDIKHTLDKLRPQVNEAILAYDTARRAYLANPTPAGLSKLQTVLGQLQSLASAVQTAIPKQ